MRKTAIIGGGNMGEALLKGLIASGADPARFVVSDPTESRRRHLADTHGVATTASNADAVREADIVVFAVKPGQLPEVIGEVRDLLESSRPLIVSVAAGVSIAAILSFTGSSARVIRVMPNTPALVGEGMSVLSAGGSASRDDLSRVMEMFSGIGRAIVLDERLMDAVTGLSGSGPAYVFLFIEALADGGVRNGIPREQALLLARQTVLGAAKLADSTGEHPGVLKDRVASPGGTTIEGIAALEQAGFRNAVIHAVTAATRKSRELGGKA